MNRTFKLYVKNSCPYCHMASKLIADKGMVYECHSLDSQPELLQEIQSKHSWKTVPMVFETTGGQNKFVGGYDDLCEYLTTGKQVLRG